jgi:hypothetical protein
LKFLSLSLLFFLPSACQVYESQGRKDFKSKASELSLSSASASLCWSQPAMDPLWQAPSHFESLTIHRISDDEIEVCLKPTSEPGATE